MAYFLYFRKRPSVRVSCLRRTFINQPYYRMKRYLNLLFLAAAALCASCARDAVVSDVPPKGEDVGGYDNNVIVGVCLFYGLLSVVSLVLGDVLMATVDPRISFNTKAR